METATGQTATPRGIAIHVTHSYQALSGTRDQYRNKAQFLPSGSLQSSGNRIKLEVCRGSWGGKGRCSY